MEPITVFIGYDASEPFAFHVAQHSLITRASVPVVIHPLIKRQLRDIATERAMDLQSTEFSFTRFLIPHLMNYQGWALFMDGDMLITADIAKLWALRDNQYAVMVVKNEQIPQEATKMLGQAQTYYPRKNWSSFMLINCARCTHLTPEAVDLAPARYLKELAWVPDEQLGELPLEWNYLSGYRICYPEGRPLPANIHYTIGGPWWKGYGGCELADVWMKEAARLVGGAYFDRLRLETIS